MSRSIGVVLAATWILCGCGKVEDGEPDEPVDSGAGGGAPSQVPEAGPPLGDPGPTPPEYCIPKCLWDLIRACTPPAATTCESSGGGGLQNSVVCDPSTGWASRRVVGGQAGTRVTLSRNGVDCLMMAFGGASPVPAVFYANGSGSTVYRTYDGTQARCSVSLDEPVIELEPERPECQPWTGPEAQLFPQIVCESTVPGDCTEAP